MLKKAPYFLLVLGLFVFIHACSKKSRQEVKKSETFTKAKPLPDYEIEENQKFASIAVYEKMRPYLDSLLLYYDSIKHFCDLDTNFLFYVEKDGFLGVVDKDGKVIIPVEYDKIYSPGGTVKGYIEVEEQDRRGLYDFAGNISVPVKYQSIYPGNNDGVLVHVRLDSLHGIVRSNGEEIFDMESGRLGKYAQSPFVNKDALNWEFNVNNESILFLQPTDYVRMENEPIEGRAVVITPSYLADMGFFPPVMQYIVMEKDADFGIAESKGKITEINSLWGSLKAAFTEYYEVGLDARGYETNKNNLVMINKKGEITGSVAFYKPYFNTSPCGGDENMFRSRFIDSSLFEVKSYVDSYESLSKDTTYSTYDEYYYYSIDSLGKIKALESNRRFAFTQFVKINDEYITGCYANIIEWDGENNANVRRNLSSEDLEVMKNEIFAGYGLLFKKDKWRAYFNAKPWYKGRLSDVNHLLTVIDKHNIAFINKTLEKMKAQPDKYAKTGKGNIPMLP